MFHTGNTSREGESGSVSMNGVSEKFIAFSPKKGDIFDIECHMAHRNKTQGVVRFFMQIEKHLSSDNYAVSILMPTFPFDRINDLPHHVGVSGGWMVVNLSDGRLLPVVSLEKQNAGALKTSIIRWKGKIDRVLSPPSYERPHVGDEVEFTRGSGVFRFTVYALTEREIYVEDTKGCYVLLNWKNGEMRQKDDIVSLSPIEAEFPTDGRDATFYIEPIACVFLGVRKKK